MSREKIGIIGLVLAVYLVLFIYIPRGIMSYIFPSLCWTLVTLVVIYVTGKDRLFSWTNKTITWMAAAVAASYIFILVDIGLILEFGKNQTSLAPFYLLINSIYVFSNLIGVELSRAYFMKNFSKKRPFLTLIIVTLFYTNLSTTLFSIPSLLNSDNLFIFIDYMGSNVLPTITENLLTSYLALLGGPLASIAYRFPLLAFEWFSPILPDISWGISSFLGVIVPLMGFLYISQVVTPMDFKKIGLNVNVRKVRAEKIQGKKEQKSIIGWTIISLVFVCMVWFSTGLFGIYPTVIVSGSMNPALDVGDIAIIANVKNHDFKEGDIIQFWREGNMIIHRIISMGNNQAENNIITKGDANDLPDPDPVIATNIKGKMFFSIPKIGWISIYSKMLFMNTWKYVSHNFLFSYMIIALSIPITLIIVLKLKNKGRKNGMLIRW